MKQYDQDPKVSRVEEAMCSVLESEDAAKEAITACEAEAQHRLHQAHRTAQRISRRTDRRISRFHERIQRVLADEIRAKKRSAENSATAVNNAPSPDAVMTAVIGQIADALTLHDEE